MAQFIYKRSRTSHTGNKVSHAKNRSKRKFKYNLHNATIVNPDGSKSRVRVTTKELRALKKAGLTTHWKPPEDK